MKKISMVLSFILCMVLIMPISVLGSNDDKLKRNQMTALKLNTILLESVSDDEYGGSYLDENLNLVVNVLESNQAITALSHSNDVIYRTVTYSLTDLKNVHDQVLNTLLEIDSNLPFAISTNLIENKIEVMLPEITQDIANEIDNLFLPSDILVITEGELSFALDVQEFSKLDNFNVDNNMNIQDKTVPINIINGNYLYQGIFWDGSFGVGAVMDVNGRLIDGFLSHGHGNFQIGDVIYYGAIPIGYISHIQSSGNVDASFITRIDSYPFNSIMTDTFIDGSTFSSFGFNPPVGTPITKYGSRTFTTHGIITDNNLTINMGGGNILSNMVYTTAFANNGDSGGPVKAMDENGIYHIVGLNTAVTRHGVYETRLIYTNILNVNEAFNVTPVVGE